MTRANDLDGLIDSVKAGTATTMRFEDAGLSGWAELAYHGSVDAALALHEQLFTESCHFNLMEDEDEGGFHAETYFNGWHYGDAETPGRALLIATLKAYLGVQEGE